jgi:hypothetical protein
MKIQKASEKTARFHGFLKRSLRRMSEQMAAPVAAVVEKANEEPRFVDWFRGFRKVNQFKRVHQVTVEGTDRKHVYIYLPPTTKVFEESWGGDRFHISLLCDILTSQQCKEKLPALYCSVENGRQLCTAGRYQPVKAGKEYSYNKFFVVKKTKKTATDVDNVEYSEEDDDDLEEYGYRKKRKEAEQAAEAALTPAAKRAKLFEYLDENVAQASQVLVGHPTDDDLERLLATQQAVRGELKVRIGELDKQVEMIEFLRRLRNLAKGTR